MKTTAAIVSVAAFAGLAAAQLPANAPVRSWEVERDAVKTRQCLTLPLASGRAARLAASRPRSWRLARSPPAFRRPTLLVRLRSPPLAAPRLQLTETPVCSGLCRSANFVQAYVNCLGDHCTGNDYTTGITLGQAVCANVGASLRSSTSPPSFPSWSDTLSFVQPQPESLVRPPMSSVPSRRFPFPPAPRPVRSSRRCFLPTRLNLFSRSLGSCILLECSRRSWRS